MVKGLPTFWEENAKCEACIYGKQRRIAFQKALGEQQGDYNLFIVMFVVLWKLHLVVVNIFFCLLMILVGWFGCIF